MQSYRNRYMYFKSCIDEISQHCHFIFRFNLFIFFSNKTYVLTIWKTCCMVILIFFWIFLSHTLYNCSNIFATILSKTDLKFIVQKKLFPAILTTRITYLFKTKIHSTSYFSFSIQQIAHILAIIWMMLFILLVGLYHPLCRFFLVVFCYLFFFFMGNQKFKRHSVVIVGCWC